MEAKRLVMTVLESGRDAWGEAGFVFLFLFVCFFSSPRKTLCLLALERGSCALRVHSVSIQHIYLREIYSSLCFMAQALRE